MIEKIVLDYLKANMKVDVYMERPKNPSKEYLLIEKTNGGTENRIKYATIAIQSYSTSLYKTAALNEMLCETMERITETTNVMTCTNNANYNYTDPTTKEYRYQAVFNIRML